MSYSDAAKQAGKIIEDMSSMIKNGTDPLVAMEIISKRYSAKD